jgi:hypothetical protein
MIIGLMIFYTIRTEDEFQAINLREIGFILKVL